MPQSLAVVSILALGMFIALLHAFVVIAHDGLVNLLEPDTFAVVSGEARRVALGDPKLHGPLDLDVVACDFAPFVFELVEAFDLKNRTQIARSANKDFFQCAVVIPMATRHIEDEFADSLARIRCFRMIVNAHDLPFL